MKHMWFFKESVEKSLWLKALVTDKAEQSIWYYPRVFNFMHHENITKTSHP